MKEMSITMALVDFVPVILFAVAAVILQQDLYNKMSREVFALFSMGTLDIIFAGAGKAFYKLLYALGICDFKLLSDMFFPLQGLGFLMAGISAFTMLYFGKKTQNIYSAALPVFAGTFIFIAFMLLGLSLLFYVLCILSVKLKKKKLILIFAISYIVSLSMGYLSSKDFTIKIINWIAESINILAQGLLLIGVIGLRKAGLSDLRLPGMKTNERI